MTASWPRLRELLQEQAFVSRKIALGRDDAEADWLAMHFLVPRPPRACPVAGSGHGSEMERMMALLNPAMSEAIGHS